MIDKENAHTREGISMIDAGSGFMKNDPTHRLRAMDFHKLDVFNRQHEVPEFPRMVSVEEIEKDNFNFNRPRYIGA